MAKTQPKIDDIKDLKKATDVSDGLMSKEDKIKLDDLDYEDLGDMPVATATKVGGIKIDFTPGNDGLIPIKLDDNNSKAYIELLADNIRYAIANDTIVNGKRYWLKNKTIIIPDGSVSVDSDYNEGLRIENAPNGYSLIALGTENTTTAAEGLNSDDKQWNIIKHPGGELTISFDDDTQTGLTLYKNGNIYWRGARLNLPRATPTINGWLHADDFRRFERVADHAQITLTSGNLQVDKETLSISGKEIFGFDNPDFDDFGLYDDGSYNLARGRRYEVIINIGMHVSTTGVVAIQLHKTGGANIKRTSTTTNVGYVSMSLSCIVDGDTSITFSILKDAATVLNLMQNECWFAVHEIK